MDTIFENKQERNPQIASVRRQFFHVVVNEEGETGDEVVDSLDYYDLRARRDLLFNTVHSAAYKARVDYFEKKLDEKRKVERALQERARLRARSSQLSGLIFTESEKGEIHINDDPPTERHETLIEHSGETPDSTGAGAGNMEKADGSATKFHLDEFFARPVRLYSGNIPLADKDVRINLPIWDLWSKDGLVRAKLANFAYFRGNMHIKIAVSGSPFHFGRLLASYQPYSEVNEVLQAYDAMKAGTMSFDSTLKGHDQYVCYLSQAPGAAYIDVKENMPVDMDIPYLNYKQRFRLFNAVASSGTGSYTDFEDAGNLRITNVNELRTAGEEFQDPVSIVVYAWCTDVELSSPSHVAFTESDKGGSDEYQSQGPVSTVASAVSEVAHNVAKVPWLYPFARATEIAATGIGDIAKIFGWSKPVVLEKALFTKNRPFANGANYAANDTAYKITLDPKQEISVDPAYGGMKGCDELAIRNIASRESFVKWYTWQIGDPVGHTIAEIPVTPVMTSSISVKSAAAETYRLQQPTAMAYAALPFYYWRGKVRIRLEFLISRYHRGKVAIIYEPSNDDTGNIRLNQQTIAIVDLQTVQEYEFDVDWAFPRQWANVEDPNTVLDSPNKDERNGVIYVKVLNELIYPTGGPNGNGIFVNAYASCPDLQVAVPRIEMAWNHGVYTESDTTTGESTLDTINPTGAKIDHLYEDHFGEVVPSFRSLLKRYVTTRGEIMLPNNTITTGAPALSICSGTHFPHVSAPYQTTNNTDPAAVTMFNYLRFAFMGMRGGIRHRTFMLNDNETNLNSYVRVSLFKRFINVATALPAYLPVEFGFSTLGRWFAAENTGTINAHVASNGGVEFETPFYSNNLFHFAFSNDEGADLSSGVGSFARSTVSGYNVAMVQQNKETSQGLFIEDTAIGEDFQFLRFQGAPYFTVGPF